MFSIGAVGPAMPALFTSTSRPSPAGEGGVDPPVERRHIGDVHLRGVQPLGGGRAHGRRVDVTHVNVGALGGERAGDREAEAARGGRDGDTEAHAVIIHVVARPATTRAIRGAASSRRTRPAE